MPVYEYHCDKHGDFEYFFRSFSAATEWEECIPCPQCEDLNPPWHSPVGCNATRIISMPLQAHLYGASSGYHKPSPSGRHSYKLIHKDGNN